MEPFKLGTSKFGTFKFGSFKFGTFNLNVVPFGNAGARKMLLGFFCWDNCK